MRIKSRFSLIILKLMKLTKSETSLSCHKITFSSIAIILLQMTKLVAAYYNQVIKVVKIFKDIWSRECLKALLVS